jgi:hypothetical protein
MSYLIRRIIGCLQNSQGAGGGVALQSWPGVYAGGSFQVLGSYHQNMIAGDPGTQYGVVSRTVTGVTWSGGSATVTTNIVHLLYTNMWVELSGVLGATGANGTWKVATVPSSTTFTVVMPDPGTWSAGAGQRMNLIVPKRLSMMPHLSIVAKEARGTELGIAGYSNNHLVPYDISSGIKQIGSIHPSSGLVKVTTTASHGFSTGNVVELSGLRLSTIAGLPTLCQGVHAVTVVDADEFTIDGSSFPTEASGTATSGSTTVMTDSGASFVVNAFVGKTLYMTSGTNAGTSRVILSNTGTAITINDTLAAGAFGGANAAGHTYVVGETAYGGIVELHTNAVSQRAALLSGGTDNPSDVAIADYQATDDFVRSYKQAASRYRDFLYSKTGWYPGYYFSTSNVGTPYEVSERGSQGSYPFALVNMTSNYTNGWAISTSQTNGGNLQLTLSKTLPAWTSSSTVRAIIFNHSNPSYGMDQFLDKSDAFTRIKGKSGTATSGSTTVLTDTGAVAAHGGFDYTVLGQRLHILGGTRNGESRTVIDFTSTTLTVDTAFGGALDNTSVYLCGTHAHPISAVSGADLTLRTPYRAADGTGGCVIFMGPISGISDSGVSDGASGNYIQLNTTDDHGLEVGNYVLISNTNVTAYNYKIATSSQLDPVATRTTVRKVLSVVDANSVVLDATYTSAANTGWWFGTVQSLAPSGYSASTRIDQPDYRRSDVKTIFNTDLKSHIDTVFARDGIRHIGLFDETSFRHASSASPVASPLAISGSLCGETSLEMIQRIGEVGTHLRNTYGVMINPNCTGYVTKDALSVAERTAIINTWGGLTSEIACYLFDRSYYQMVEGWLAHIEGIVSNGGAYYYQPQERVVQSTALAAGTNSGSDSGRLQITMLSDAGFFPTDGESDAGSHNHSGHIIGIYGHSKAAVNGVHRVRSTDVDLGPYTATLETRYVDAATHDGTGGTAVYSNCIAPHKILGLTAGTAVSGGNRWLCTTEFPHGIPLLAEGDTWTRIYGYASTTAAIPDGSLLKVDVKSSTTFEILDDATYKHTGSDDTTDGIVFHIGNNSTTYGADEEHWYGIAYMLWLPGYALYFNRGALNRHVSHDVTHENVHPWLPAGLTPDSTYSVVSHDGTATSTDATNPKLDINAAGATFTDAVLGEQLLFTNGDNDGEWRRIVQVMSSTKVKVDANFTNDVSSGDTFVIGKTDADDPTKVLELKRTFDGATKTVQVFPQKTYVTYTGFTWDTDA